MSNPSVQEDKTQQLSPLQKAAFALKKLDAKLNSILYEPIAIIGMGCSFPGGANSTEKFWELLRGGISAREEIPPERWNIDAYYNPDREAPGKMVTRYGHFIKGVEQFDPGFFGISPREATAMDPQHRLLLEVSWQALERAGQKIERLSSAPVGVFVGNDGHDYEQIIHEHLKQQPNSPLSIYAGTGNSISSAAGRLAYTFGFTGPTVTIDTACSSSLVAIHQACNSIHLGECQMAIAGGVKLHLTPEGYIFTSRARMLSPDGLCKTFDISADGYGRGEGCGMIVLKRLSQAKADGDRILALIRGSAVNQDGPSSGLTVPNGQSQQKLIEQALKQARVKPAEIGYLEAHGTGTSLGDPIEVNAAATVLGQERPPEQPLWMGTVKTNIGHLESAAGVSGLIKVVLSLQHQQLPPHLHLQQPNPKIDWQPWLRVPQVLTPWVTQKSRLAAVNSFGFTGTNAHVVLEEAPKPQISTSEVTAPLHILTLSAKTEKALKSLVSIYSDYLATNSDFSLKDICFTANKGRSHFHHRVSVISTSTRELAEKLGLYKTGQQPVGLLQEEAKNEPKIVFLFTGQGSQYVGMGRELYETQSTFRNIIHRCNEILLSYLEIPILEILYPGIESKNQSNIQHPTSNINETVYTQPALFVLEYALSKLWESWGIKPNVVMGHSVGEYVAACIAGVFSLEDGLKLIATRGRLMQALPQDGMMISVLANEKTIKQVIKEYEEVSVAAINGPESIVISGKSGAIEAIIANLEAQNIKTSKLSVSHAFHSPLMEPMLHEFEQVAQEISYFEPKIKLISNVTGKQTTTEITTPEYWCRHIKQPVRFADSMKTLQKQGYQVFLEIGSKPILLGMGRHCIDDEKALWLPSLREDRSDWQQLLSSLGSLYVRGATIDWESFYQDYFCQYLELPTYPFEKQRYWVDSVAKEQLKTSSLPDNEVYTSIIKNLQQKNIEQLIRELQQSTAFSAQELEILPKFVKTLVQENQQQETESVIKDWLYQIQWQLQPRQTNVARNQKQTENKGKFLIFSDSSDIGNNLVEIIESLDNSTIIVYPGKTYQKLSNNTWQLNPDRKEDFEHFWQEVFRVEQLPLRGVVHLWSLDVTKSEKLNISALAKAQKLVCGSVLFLVQMLLKYNQSNTAKLWLITKGAQAVEEKKDQLEVAQGSLWGMGKVIALEQPQLWGGMIDLASSLDSPQEEAAKLWAEIEDTEGEDYLAFRNGKRYVARLCKYKPKERENHKLALSTENSYLITGGLGVLGIRVAKWLVNKGVQYLVLLGRSEASQKAQESINWMKETGVKVLVVRGNVSDYGQMTSLFEQIQASMPPLRGVIHTAGVPGYQPILQIELDSFEYVLQPKTLGTWILHQLTQEQNLNFFVNFSSISSAWGSKGQAHYAAANSFLDGFAYYRQSIGLPALTINWGPWGGGGMTTEEALIHLNRMGVEGLEPEKAIGALEYLLKTDEVEAVVAKVDWHILKELYQAKAKGSLLKAIKVESTAKTSEVEVKQNDLLQKLIISSESECQKLLISYLQAEIVKVLGLGSSEQLDPQISLDEVGLDSLAGFELTNQIKSQLGMTLSASKLFQGLSIIEITEELIKQLTQQYSSSTIIDSADLRKNLVEETTNDWIVPHQLNTNTELRLFCLHHLGGNASFFRKWSEILPKTIEVCPIEFPGRGKRFNQPPMTDFSVLLDNLVPVISEYLDKPFAFYGHSAGAIVAFELAIRLRQYCDREPIHLFVGASYAPHSLTDGFKEIQLPLEQLLDVWEIPETIRKEQWFQEELVPILNADGKLFSSYKYSKQKPLNCPITAFGGVEDKLINKNDLSKWYQNTNSIFKLQMLPGKHLFLKSDRSQLLKAIEQDLKSTFMKLI